MPSARLLAVSAAVLLAGCAPGYSPVLVATTQQSIRYDSGTPTLVSIKERGAVRISQVHSRYNGRMAIAVVAINRGDIPATLGYENIRITNPDGSTVRSYTSSDLKRETRRRAASGAAAAAMAGAPNAYAAAQSGHQTQYGKVSTYTPYGTAYATYTATAYNPAVAPSTERQADEDTDADMNGVADQLNATLASLNGRILRTTTIAPGGSAGGEIIAARPKLAKSGPSNVVVDVDFNGEQHEFTFAVGDPRSH
jgi:hypothetical protein